VIQGSEEWKQCRLGKVTASRMADVLARTQNGYRASRANYLAQLIAERLTGVPQDTYQNAAMVHGIETEPEARAAYEFRTDQVVQEIGFINHPRIEDSGCSPDGLIGTDGLIEIKCPNTATHIETLLTRGIADKYLAQMQWQMACTGRRWCDFVSFDPRMPEHLRFCVIRVNRDDPRIQEMEREVDSFLIELKDKISRLETIR
jgi:putative phage-type endonuclease